MIKVVVKNEINSLQWMGEFPNQSEVDSWIAKEIKNNSWGLPERQVMVAPAIYNEETGEEIVPAAYETHEAEYTIEQTDVTSEFELESEKLAKIEAGKAAREVCQMILDYISGTNLNKALTIEQITLMQQTFAHPEAALRAGRPGLAKMLIAAIQPDGFMVTESEKQIILDMLAGY